MSLQAKCFEVPTAWTCSSEGEGGTFVSHLKMGRQEFFYFILLLFFLLKRKGGPTLCLEKVTKIPQPSPPPPEKNVSTLNHRK